jgi:hypothetical protein
MAVDLTALYERSKIGPTLQLVFDDSASSRLELADDTKAQANQLAPVLFLVRTTADVHLRQGSNAVEATTGDFLLFGDSYYPIVVEDGRDNHLAAIAPAGGSGVVFATKVSEL